jgi:hypothetical protein
LAVTGEVAVRSSAVRVLTPVSATVKSVCVTIRMASVWVLWSTWSKTVSAE